MLVFVCNLEDAKIPEIWESEEEKSLSDRELKKVCFSWALQNLRGRAFARKLEGTVIHVSRDGLGEWKTVLKHTAPYPKGQECAVVVRFQATACIQCYQNHDICQYGNSKKRNFVMKWEMALCFSLAYPRRYSGSFEPVLSPLRATGFCASCGA